MRRVRFDENGNSRSSSSIDEREREKQMLQFIFVDDLTGEEEIHHRSLSISSIIDCDNFKVLE